MQNNLPKIAIIDDDKIYQLTVKVVLNNSAKFGQIWQFTEAQAALDFLEYHAQEAELLPDMILLDINMPHIDGWGFLEHYNNLSGRLSKKIAVCMVSSSLDAKDQSRAHNHPLVAGYLLKPILADSVPRILAHLNLVS